MNKEERYGVDITQSAIIIFQVLRGNFTNLKDGVGLDISRMRNNELSELTSALLKSNTKNITLRNSYANPGENQSSTSTQVHPLSPFH